MNILFVALYTFMCVIYDWPISTRVRRLCELLTNCDFALRGSESFGS